MAMRKKPSVDEFIGSAAANDTRTSKGKIEENSIAGKDRVSKLVRIPRGMLIKIKRRAIDESEHRGERISENDIVELALSQYLATKIS